MSRPLDISTPASCASLTASATVARMTAASCSSRKCTTSLHPAPSLRRHQPSHRLQARGRRLLTTCRCRAPPLS
eukprot:2717913-Pleurochrysis_carterae.AAC.1